MTRTDPDSRGPFALDVPRTTPLDFGRLPSGRHQLPREVMEESQRRRLLAAAVVSVGTHGYLASSVHQIVRCAGVGTKTFARHFEDRDECIAAAYEMTVAWLEEQVGDAVASPAPWPAQLQAATRRTLELLDTDPPARPPLRGRDVPRRTACPGAPPRAG